MPLGARLFCFCGAVLLPQETQARTLKVGKDVGNAMKMGDADIAASARKVVGEIQALAQRAGIGL